MSNVQTKVVKEPWEVSKRLAQLDLTKDGLLKVRDMALSAAADATPFHATNAEGTFAYHYGTYGLREGFVVPGGNWQIDRPDGLEAIRNDVTNTLVVFGNVDLACNDVHEPKPRSKKGSGAERASQTTLFAYLPMPQYAPMTDGRRALYYLMVDENGAAELTRPVVSDGTFVAYIERIYLSYGDDLDRTAINLDNSDTATDFDPQVTRKVG